LKIVSLPRIWDESANVRIWTLAEIEILCDESSIKKTESKTVIIAFLLLNEETWGNKYEINEWWKTTEPNIG
jgi:hypothetical protein